MPQKKYPGNYNDSTQIPFKKPPFPPNIDPTEMAKKRTKSQDPRKINSRGPNCFMVYRSYCTSINGRIHMAKLSTAIAKSWEDEPPEVKTHYKKLANLIEYELTKQRRCNEIHFLWCEMQGKTSEEKNLDKVTTPTNVILELDTQGNDYGVNETRTRELLDYEIWDPFVYKP
ncbi:13462_t:CDS:1, partial [Acaulospora morrowiae]